MVRASFDDDLLSFSGPFRCGDTVAGVTRRAVRFASERAAERPASLGASDVASVLALIDALAVISLAAHRHSNPVIDFVRATAAAKGPYASEPLAADLSWAVKRAWGGLDGLGQPKDREFWESSLGPFPDEPGALLRSRSASVGRRIPGGFLSPMSRLTVLRVSLGSPLHVLFELPWTLSSLAGASVVFVKAVEYWLASSGRVRTTAAEQEADRLEAEVRQLRATQEIGVLQTAQDPAIVTGSLEGAPGSFETPTASLEGPPPESDE